MSYNQSNIQSNYYGYHSDTLSTHSSNPVEPNNTFEPILNNNENPNVNDSSSTIESSSTNVMSQPTNIPANLFSSKKHANLSDTEKNYKLFSRAFFITSLISAFLILLFEAYMYAVINIHRQDFIHGKYVENSIYFALFIFAAIFQVIITVIALYSRNLLLLIFLMGFYCCMLIYTGIQYNEVGDKISIVLTGQWKTATHAMNIATICVIAATLVIQSILLYFGLRRYVSWFIFKKIGASLKLKNMYAIFQIHRSILMFDFFFFTGFTIQFLVIMVRDKSSVEFILTVIVIPLTIILLFISDVSSTREFIYGSIFAIVLYLCGIAYVLFKIIRLYTKYTSAYNLAIAPGEYFMGRKSLLTFGIITLALLVATIVLEIIVITNYHKGLLPFVSLSYKWIPGYNKRGTHNEIDINDDDEGKARDQEENKTDSNSLCID
ncbi:SPAC23H3.04 UPF0658 Golgi apparatus membrane protein C23H3.04 [Candida maltosa Xu316]|uniref:Uncharacterized protein n=1 Tax=Candida maltosa (strain Xu316) TaxID=1245528 RepID=M3HLP0_CANMX|nr:hypothetical protein G210_1096 [Candida maltosa Xu316]